MKKIILIALLALTACQKDYYLDDLNTANSQIKSLEQGLFEIQNNLNSVQNALSTTRVQLEREINNNRSVATVLTNFLGNLGVSTFEEAINKVNGLELALQNAVSQEDLDDLQQELKEFALQLVYDWDLNFFYYTDYYSEIPIANRVFRNHIVNTGPPNVSGGESVLMGDINTSPNIFSMQISWRYGKIYSVSIAQPRTSISFRRNITEQSKGKVALEVINFLYNN